MLILKPITQITANNKKDLVNGFLNSMSLSVFYYMYDEKEWREIGLMPDEHAKLLVANMILAKPLLKELHINNRDWNTIISLYTTGEYKSSEDDEYAMYNIAVDLFKAKKIIARSTLLTQEQKTYIQDWSIVFRVENPDPAISRIKQKVGHMVGPKVAKYFPTTMKSDVKKQIKLSKDADTLRKRVTKKDGTLNKNHRDYEKYAETNKNAKNLSKQILYDFVRQNGGKVDVEDARKYLDNLGVNHTLPNDFIGMIGEGNTYYTKFGEELKNAPPGNSKITMNRTYKEGSTNWYYAALPYSSTTGVMQRYYTKKSNARSKTKKFANTRNFIEHLKKYKKRWRGYLMQIVMQQKHGLKGSMEKQFGVMCELLYWTSERIGTKAKGGGIGGAKGTFGLSTMLNKHVTIRGDKVRVKYIGKGGSKVDFILDMKNVDGDEKKYMKELIKFFKVSKKNGKPDGQVFEWKNANNFRYKFLKGKLGADITPHNFRHMRGTIILDEMIPSAIERLGDDPNAKDVLQEFDKMTKEVGKELGHYTTAGGITGVTAIKNYLDPAMMTEFFNRYPYVKVPAALKSVQKSIKAD